MSYDDLPSRIEHTVLGSETTPQDVITALDSAIEYGMDACVPPCYVPLADSYAPGVQLATVIGYPNGQHRPSIKAAEAEQAQADGADELAVVCNVGRLKAGEDDGVGEDLAEVIAATSLPVSVIVEARLLTEGERDRIAQLAADVGAHQLVTSTTFEPGKPAVDTIEQLADYLPVKVTGAISSWEDARPLLDAGGVRIGTPHGEEIIEDYRDA